MKTFEDYYNKKLKDLVKYAKRDKMNIFIHLYILI